MRGLGIFNIVYGGLGLLASLYLHRVDGIAVSLWVMGGGTAMVLGVHRALMRRVAAVFPARLRRTRSAQNP